MMLRLKFYEYRSFLLGSGIFALGLLLRLIGALWEPYGRLYNVDELSLANSAHLVAIGLTPTTLAWPSGTVLLPLSLIYHAQMLMQRNVVALILGRQPNALLTLLVENLAYYRLSPWRDLILGRLLVAVVASLTPLISFRLLYRRYPFIAVGTSLVLATSPAFVVLSWSLQSDAVAIALWSASLILLLWYRPIRSWRVLTLCGILFGMAVASKFIYGILTPITILSLLSSSDSKGYVLHKCVIKSLAFLGLTGITLTLFCPFVWTAPLTVGKSVVGNVLVKIGSGGNSWGLLPNTIGSHFVSWPATLLLAIGVTLGWKVIGVKRIVLLGLTLILGTVMVGQAQNYEVRYALPILPALAVMFGVGWQAVLLSFPVSWRKATLFIVAVSVSGMIFWNTMSIMRHLQRTHQPTAPFSVTCVERIESLLPRNTRVAVPRQMEIYLVPSVPALRRLISQNRDDGFLQNRIESLFEVIGAGSDSEGQTISTARPIIRAIFGHDEEQTATLLGSLLWLQQNRRLDRPTFDLYPYFVEGQRRVHDLHLTEVTDMFNKGEIEAIVSFQPVEGLRNNPTVTPVLDSTGRQVCLIYSQRDLLR